MSETLLTSSSIKLFGRVLNDLLYRYDLSTLIIGANNFLQAQLNSSISAVAFTGTAVNNGTQITSFVITTANAKLFPGMSVTGPAGVLLNNTVIVQVDSTNSILTISPQTQTAAAALSVFSASISPSFARIYAFSFEGSIYTMPKPSIFLVHGAGLPVDGPAGGGGRTTTDQSGVIAREWEFSAAATPKSIQDLRFWEYEKGDFSLRLEPESGPLDQILLQFALRGGADRSDRSGAGLEVRSGAGVSGAGVSGAGVSGAGVSGAGLRR